MKIVLLRKDGRPRPLPSPFTRPSLQRVVVPLGAGLVELPQDQGDRKRTVRQDHSADERIAVEALAVRHRSGSRRGRRGWGRVRSGRWRRGGRAGRGGVVIVRSGRRGGRGARRCGIIRNRGGRRGCGGRCCGCSGCRAGGSGVVRCLSGRCRRGRTGRVSIRYRRWRRRIRDCRRYIGTALSSSPGNGHHRKRQQHITQLRHIIVYSSATQSAFQTASSSVVPPTDDDSGT